MYDVVWLPEAEDDLAAIWVAAGDRAAVSLAAARIDQRLERDPLRWGESRVSSIHRVGYEGPLGVDFDVIEDDKRVVVLAAFSAR